MENRNVLFSGGKWTYCIVAPLFPSVGEEFAVSELKRYLSLIAGKPIDVKKKTTGLAIKVGQQFAERIDDIESLGENGFAIQSDEKDIVISSCGEKGVLNGVYEFLEVLGCRWYMPRLEIVPRSKSISMKDFNVRMKPSFSTITFFQDTGSYRDYSVEPMKVIQQRNDRDLLDWMGKNKMNAIMGIALDDAEEREERRKRALSIEFGGHFIPALLPRDHFSEHPEYFPMGKDGKRNRDGNMCCSNKGAIEVIRKNAIKMVEKQRGLVFHVWGRDVAEGAWCSCEECKKMTVQDQYMKVVNAVAEAVEKVQPSLRVAYIAYYDTLTPNLSVKPRTNVTLLFAPRTRCYGHALDSEDCQTNPNIFRGLKKYMEIFGPGNGATFEYFGDSYLYCSVAASIPETVGADMKQYFKVGIGEAGCLFFGGYSWWAHPLNQYVFAKVAFNIETNVEALLLDYVNDMFPSASREMFAYYQELERTVGPLLRVSDWRYKAPQQALKKEYLAIVERVLSGVKKLRARLDELDAFLSGKEKRRLQKEKSILEVTILFVRSFRDEMFGNRRLIRYHNMKDASLLYEARDYFTKAEAGLERMTAYLGKIDPLLRGSWGYNGQGEIKRIEDRLLRGIRQKKEEITQLLEHICNVTRALRY